MSQALSDHSKCMADPRRGGVLAGLLVVAGLGDAGVGGGWRARLHRRFL